MGGPQEPPHACRRIGGRQDGGETITAANVKEAHDAEEGSLIDRKSRAKNRTTNEKRLYRVGENNLRENSICNASSIGARERESESSEREVVRD